MTTVLIRLKVELQQRHWQTHAAFCREYDRVAETIDPELVGEGPGPAQFHRWLRGDVKGLPYPHHCQVLEKMFPGYTAAELFQPWTPDPRPALTAPIESEGLARGVVDVIGDRIKRPAFGAIEWGPEQSNEASLVHAASSTHSPSDGSETTAVLARRLLQLKRTRRLTDGEVGQLAYLAGNVIDLDSSTDIQISSDGSACLSFRYTVLNLTDRPLTRLSRELWFESTDGRLDIKPLREAERRIAIQRIHDTAHLAKFACQLSPPVQPGESAVVGYVCTGGKFVGAHYWRRSIYRYTRRFALNLRHINAGDLSSCSAVEEHPDGAENSATEALIWDTEGNDVIINLSREYLRPNQSITLHWKVAHEHS
ncbi:hypothetical protein ACW9HR_35820 [Nocardia gipuzkoensis]